MALCAGVDAVFETGAPLPPFDVHAPFMSLPRLFGTTLESIPADVPYLYSDVALRKRWREQLGNGAGLKVGIVWQGNARYGGDRYRSVPLASFRPVADIPGVRLCAGRCKSVQAVSTKRGVWQKRENMKRLWRETGKQPGCTAAAARIGAALCAAGRRCGQHKQSQPFPRS